MSGLSHCFFLILTIIFPPFILLWVCVAVSEGNKRKRKQDRERQEELELLRELVRKGK